MKKSFFSILPFCALSILASCLASCLTSCSLQPPLAQSGVLDLGSSDDTVHPLIGEWLRLGADPEDAGSPVSVSLRSVVSWKRSPQGPARYRILVRLGSPGSYALSVPSLGSYEEISVNGTKLYDRKSGSNTTSIGSGCFPFIAPDSDAVVELSVGPDDSALEAEAMLPRVPVIGSAQAVDIFRVGTAALALILPCLFVIGAIFTASFAFIARERSIHLATLAFFLLSAAFYSLMKQANAIFPGNFPNAFIQRGYLASIGLLYTALAFFFNSLFPRKIPLLLPFALAVLTLMATVLGFSGFYGMVWWISSGLYLLAGAFLLIVTFIAAIRKDSQAKWFLPAFVVIIMAMAMRLVFPDSLLSAIILEPLGIAVFGFISTTVLIRRLSALFVEIDTLEKNIAEVSSTVRRFVPDEFLGYLEKNSVSELKLGDHIKKDMTIFFSDIRAFTELSERLTPEENFAFVNSYLSRVVPLISERGGFVDKYIGDAIMALYAGDMNADRAVETAIEMQRRIVEYNGHRANTGYQPISMGVGIHTGTLMLGVVGIKDRLEGTVISDAVNLASRLQSIAKAFDVGTVISEQSFKVLQDPGKYQYRFIGKIKVRGKAAPMAIFEIFDGLDGHLYSKKMESSMFFEQGMLAYYQKNFTEAVYFFKRALTIAPEDGAAKFYLETGSRKLA